MRLPFALKHALREGRTTWRRIGLYMGSITLGVAALVAINSFRSNILAAVHDESRGLLGADLEIHSTRPMPDAVERLLDSLDQAGVPVSHLTTTPSMALAPRTGFARLVQVKGLSGGYPYYGRLETRPDSAWRTFQGGNFAVVDRAVTVQLEVDIGDSLLIGEAQFVIVGLIATAPSEVSFQSAIGPRVFIPAAALAETGLLRFGSLARYQAFLKIEDHERLQAFLGQYPDSFFRDNQVGYDTVAERVRDLTAAVNNMTRFLGLVGLTALLLGGVGVASAVHVFIKEKLDTVAILRCLGATQRTVFSAYLLQAGVLGFAGASLGALLGIGVQTVLPSVLGDFLPLEVGVSVDWVVVAIGLVIGLWVSSVFAFLPLLAIWDVSPLRALRREFESVASSHKGWSRMAYVAMIASIVLISLWQAPTPGMGAAFATAITLTTGLLYGMARLLIHITRRHFPRRARYVIRQGVANLFRPHNQTVAVTIALGFGVFLIATIYIVQGNVLEPFDIQAGAERPNLVAFDIQADQRDSVVSVLTSHGATVLRMTAIVPARISALNGRAAEEILADTTQRGPARWALRREYRNTYRDTLVATEELVLGEWWGPSTDTPDTGEEPSPDGAWPRISIEEDIAENLRVGVGDRITWDMQGIELETVIASTRRVDWARFEPNFFVVFEPGTLEDAPQSFVTMTRLDDEVKRAELQRDMVRAFPNIAVADLALVLEAIDGIVSKVTLAIRFMAAFSIASGMVVLIGAVSTSRFHRVRESVLLKTLGASRKQIRQIFSTEYATLGTLAGLTGILLAGMAGWGLVRFLFELRFSIPSVPLIGLWASVTGLTTIVGLASSRKVLTKAPLAVIREIDE